MFSVNKISSVSDTVDFFLDYPKLDVCPVHFDGQFLHIEGWAVGKIEKIIQVALYNEIFYRNPLLISNLSHRPDVAAVFNLDQDSQVAFRFDLSLIGLQNITNILLAVITESQFSGFATNASFGAGHFTTISNIEIGVSQRSLAYQASSLPKCTLGEDSTLGPEASVVKPEQGTNPTTATALGRSNNTAIPTEKSSESKIRPLFITSLGRSGSTALMACLSKSPDIFISGAYPYESRPLSYFINMMRLSVSPSPNYIPISQGCFLDVPFLSSTNPFIDAVHYGDLYNTFNKKGIDIIKSSSNSFIENLCDQKSFENNGASGFRFVAEKLAPNTVVAAVCELIWDDTVEIIVIRELADWIRSGIQFSLKSGKYFGEQMNVHVLIDNIIKDVRAFIKYVASRGNRSVKVKYESFFSDQNFLPLFFGNFDINITPEMFSIFLNPEKKHVTSGLEIPILFYQITEHTDIKNLIHEYNDIFNYSDASPW